MIGLVRSGKNFCGLGGSKNFGLSWVVF